MKKNDLINLLQTLEPISLSDLDSVKLLNRVDRKYVIPIKSLPAIIRLLSDQYSVLEINGCRAFTYETTYFDTSEYRFFRDHHNHLSSRIKVRTRTYKESDLHFFEIKMKTNFRTDKIRQRLPEQSNALSETQCEKIKSLYAKELGNPLVPSLINTYTRITLVNSERTERCTLDVNLSFQDPDATGKIISVKDIAIIEVKQSKACVLKGIIASLKTKRIYPSSISKYVLGLILVHPEIKHNGFKPLMHRINTIKKKNNLSTNIKTINNYEKINPPVTRMHLF